MFEKEAKEWVKENTRIEYSTMFGDINVEPSAEKGFQKGAEFGYNKANEWQYVKDGKYPTHSYRVLVLTDEGVGYGIYGLDDKQWHTYDTGFEVIAWKEIYTPKELEELAE